MSKAQTRKSGRRRLREPSPGERERNRETNRGKVWDEVREKFDHHRRPSDVREVHACPDNYR